MDLVYVNVKSNWNSNELRFSLRSAEKFLSFDKVFIIGYLPEFISPYKVIYIPFQDNPAQKYKSVNAKVRLILENPDISEDFIFMNDDFWLLKEWKTIPYYYYRTLADRIKYRTGGTYLQRLENTLKIFPNGLNYELHCPIVFNKEKLRKVLEKYGEEVERRSAYCNEYKVPSVEMRDYKIFKVKNLALLKDAPFFSADDTVVLQPEFQKFIFSLFPKPSYFEVDDLDKMKQKREELIKTIELYKKKNYQKYLQKKKELESKLRFLNLICQEK